jgi:hypothetical protein
MKLASEKDPFNGIVEKAIRSKIKAVTDKEIEKLRTSRK